jgi:hypothetical protein
VAVNGDGTVTYTHDGSETTSDSFSYTIKDVSGAVSTSATVSLTVTPQNDPPSAVADSATVLEGGSVGIDLATNDTDPDNALDLTSIQIVSGPANGSLVVNGDGTVTYTHDGSETTSDSFSYTIRDAAGAVSSSATVSLTVTPQNDPPSAVADSATVLEGGSVGIDLAANDTDSDNALDLGSIQIVSGPANGSLVVNGDGTVTYTHDGSETTSDSFSYTIKDARGAVSNTATVSLTVTPQNDAPTAVADSATVLEGGSVGIDLAANDADSDSALDLTSIQIVSSPANGSLVFNGDGTATYTHDGGETVTDAFSYTIRDTAGTLSNVATVSITVTPHNDSPNAVADSATVDEGGSTTIDLAANDTDSDNPLDLGSIAIVWAEGNGSVVVNDDGTVTYTHDGSETTSDSFGYTIRDAAGATSNTATVSLAVNPVDEAPLAIDAEVIAAQENVSGAQSSNLESASGALSADREASSESSSQPSSEPTPEGAVTPAPHAGQQDVIAPQETAAPVRPSALRPAGTAHAPVQDGAAAIAAANSPERLREDEIGSPARSETELSSQPPTANPLFHQSLEQMQEDLAADADREAEERAGIVARAEGVALAVSTGVLAAFMRSGSMLAVALSSLPLWRRVDPLAVLALSDEERWKREQKLREAEEVEDGDGTGIGRVLDDGTTPGPGDEDEEDESGRR